MSEEQFLLRKIYWLLGFGGSIVFFAFWSGFFFDNTSWFKWWIDNGFHTLGGAYAFFFSRAILRYVMMHHDIRLSFGVELFVCVGGALIIGVFWEWYELIIDRYEVFILRLPSIMTYADTVGDLAFDTFGALIAALFLLRRNKK